MTASRTPGVPVLVTGSAGTRNFLAAVLRQNGWLTVPAEGATEALRLIQQGRVALAILDQTLAGSLEGAALLHTAAARQLPVLILGGQEPAPAAGEARGPVAYLSRPPRARDLLTAVHALLAPRRGRRDSAAGPAAPAGRPADTGAPPTWAGSDWLIGPLRHQVIGHLIDTLAQDLEDLMAAIHASRTEPGQHLPAGSREQEALAGIAGAGERTAALLRQLAVCWQQSGGS